ncbi:redox-regulated ATPase YchF [Candidatus Parcubacteria bacterium]|nr:redox-regulated ATPase YchF [Patescibacteria group bacterium]MBU4309605.1 redox-regulated ATPase YchF [Patescibacteria group bacterium]MBU4432147.1 redox-regulated ATPase YchF [Patescibacteria group bacterium]MBU4578007.1 redox-regulated ATPase YchF [Patescibacteria group bacterium]MCG2696485.1 redox-regulated ATPase YchF [Candidatus Parcubacteria bacterium]
MSLSIGIVGLPNVGKSTLFNTLTKKKAEAANYPFCTIDPNVGVVKVPDERLEKLSAISQSKKLIPTTIDFIDIAGLVKGASKGEGLGNQFLANIRECDAICEVVRNFEDSNIIHVNNKIDPEDDRETINLELILADLQSVEKKYDRLVKDSKSGDKLTVKTRDIVEKIKTQLEAGKAVRAMTFDEEEQKIVKSLNLLSVKPILYVVNTSDVSRPLDTTKWDGEVLSLNIKLEDEIASLPEEEQAEYVQELGLDESGLDKLIKTSYKLLGLMTFLTTGKEETRAWTVKVGSKAPQAAGEIHTDIEKGFVRAEVINWEKYVEAGGEAAAKEKGLMRIEGKEYVMQDGDVVHFLHNK